MGFPIVTLRKGQSSVYLQYASSGDSIGANNFTASVRTGKAFLSFRLRPVDSNQRSDMERLVDEALVDITINDAQVSERLASFCRAHWTHGLPRHVEILGAHARLEFPVEFEEGDDESTVRVVINQA